MACENCTIDLTSCAPYLSFESGQDLLELIQNQACCASIGIIDSTVNDPLSDPINTTIAAFPNGVPLCCGCIFIISSDGNVYISCDDGDTWYQLNPADCVGILTTMGLDPTNDPAGTVLEGWGASGINCTECEIAWVVTEDDRLCWSEDCGATWHCGNGADATTYSNDTTVHFPISFLGIIPTNVQFGEQDPNNLLSMTGASWSVVNTCIYTVEAYLRVQNPFILVPFNTDNLAIALYENGIVVAGSGQVVGADNTSGTSNYHMVSYAWSGTLNAGSTYELRIYNIPVLATANGTLADYTSILTKQSC